MARDSLSKYVKKPVAKTKSIAQSSGSWLSNAMKSIGYSSFDILEELLPSTIDAAKVTATTGKDIATSIRQARTTDRTLKAAIDRNYYLGLGREIFKNSLEDLKSGKFYNKDRADKFFADMNSDMMDMGDGFEDFDAGEDSFNDSFDSSVDSADGMAHATIKRRKAGRNETTSIVVGTDLGPDSAIYQITAHQTETMVNVGRAMVDHSNTNARATLTMLGHIRNEVSASLTSLNENVSMISSTVSESLSKHTSLSAKYYEDSIALQTQILEAIKGQANTQVNTRQFREYNNVMDMFSAGGSIDPKAYLQLVGKQLDSYIDSNMFLSQLKFMAGEKETLRMMAQNPLAFIPKAITKQLIPATVKSVITEFDNQLKETGIAALNQLSGLQRSGNPVLAALGKILGVQNKITISSIDKGAYNKGATAWTGTDHQALTNVIPTLLRKIYASVSGTEEVAFDYEKGVFVKLKDMEKQFEKDKMSRATSMFSDYKSDFRDFVDKNVAASKEEKAEFDKAMEKFIYGVVMDSYGGRTFRKGGRNGKGGDDIKELLGASSSDDPRVKLIRAFFEGMEGVDNSRVTSFFGSKIQEQRAAFDKQMREMQSDPTRFNTMYMDTGLGGFDRHSKQTGNGNRYGSFTDAHLNYNNEGTKIRGVAGGALSGAVDKYGHTQVHYLREILNTLNTGIYVVPVTSISDGGSGGNGPDSDFMTRFNARISNVSSVFKEDKDKYNREQTALNPTSTYTDDKRRDDINKGKVDSQDDNVFNQTALSTRAADYHKGQKETSDAKNSLFAKLFEWLPSDSNAAKMLMRVQNGMDNSKEGLTKVFRMADTALFELVFGNGNGNRGVHALFDKALGVFKAGFFKFSTFIDEKVLKPLDEALFGESGVFNKIKQTELWQNVTKSFHEITVRFQRFFMGDKDADGKYTGGLFSETANSLKNMGSQVKTAILGEKGPDGKPLPLESDNSVLGGLKRMFRGVTENVSNAIGLDPNKPKESLGTKIANGMDAIYNRMRERGKEFSDNIFGESLNGPEFLKQFKEDMKGQKGNIGASAVVGAVGAMVLNGHLGLLGSMFLPGGPIGGALLGGAIGIISKSSGLKDYLFGPEVTGKDGKTFRAGGLITKDFQDFIKNNKNGIIAGGLGGLAASFGLLPALFFPGGPIGGALMGGAISLATKSEAFQRFLYGEGGTKDDPTGGIMKKMKEVFGKRKDMKGLALDAGIGAGVGLVGSFFLPGGPILGALLGSAASVGLATDKFKNWFFGEQDEETGKRSGGVFGKFTGYMKDKIFDPLGKTVKIAQVKILGFVEENMVAPFRAALDPILTQAKYVGGVIKEKITGLFDSIKGAFHKHVTQPIGETVDKYLLQPIKRTLSKLFKGLGTVLGGIISAPFRMFGLVGKAAHEANKKRGAKTYTDQVDQQWKDEGGFLGHFRKSRDGGNGFLSSLFNALRGPQYDKDKLREAQFGEHGANYNSMYEGRLEELQKDARAKTDAKVTAILNGTDVVDNNAKLVGTVKGINFKEFAKRTGLSNTAVKKLIKGGKLPAVENGKFNWVIDPKLVAQFKTKVNTEPTGSTTTTGTPVPTEASTHTTGTAGETDSGDVTQVVTTATSEVGKPAKKQSRKEKKAAAKAAKQETKKNDKTKVNTEPTGSTTTTGTPVPTEASTHTTGTAGETDSGRRKSDISIPTDFYTKMLKNVGQIADSVYGQLNGVGSNANKIYRLLLKKNGMEDDDIKGDNNKQYVGFLGRLRTALNRPLEAISNMITAPFRKISEFGRKIVDKVANIPRALGKAGKKLLDGIGSIAGGIGNAVKELGGVVKDIIKLPFDLASTALSAVREALPAIGEAVKAGATVISTGVKVAGEALITGVKAIGTTVTEMASGFGQMLGGAMSGLGSILSSAGIIGKDVLLGAWKGAKFLGKTALKVGSAVASAPVKLIGGLTGGLGKIGSGLFGKGVQHVIVDSGTLDKVKFVNAVGLVKKIKESGGKGGDGDIKSIRPAKPIRTIFGGFGAVKEEDKPKTHVILDGLSDTVQAIFEKWFGDGESPLESRFLDRNTGDTSVNTGQTAGGGADDDSNKTDNVDSLMTGAGWGSVKAAWGDAKVKMSNAWGAAKDAFNTKIANRQAQVDKGSRTSLLSRFAAADKDKEETEFRARLIENTGKTAVATEQHKAGWDSIFSKKGLITGALILALPLIMKFIKKFKLDELINNLINSVTTGWSEIGGLKGLINNLLEKKQQAEDIIDGKETQHVIDEDGNLVYNEDGSLATERVDRNRLSTLLMPTRTRVDVDTGKWENRREWTNMSGATANVLAHKVAIPAAKALDKGFQVAKKIASGGVKAGKGVANWVKSGAELNALAAKGYTELAGSASLSQKMAAKVAGAGAKVANAGKTALNTGKNLADNAVSAVANSKAVTKMKGLADDVGKAAMGNEVIAKFITKATEAIKFLVSKLVGLGEKFGVKLAEGKFAKVIQFITTKLLNPKKLAGFAKRIGKFLTDITGKSTVAGATIFIAEIAFVTYGAIDGAVNAGALFEVNPDAVDAKMRAIAAVFKGILNTTAGSVVDFVNALAADILGFNFVKDIASWTYNLLSNEEDEAALKAAQDDFTQGYEDYVEKEYEAYKKGAEAQGQEAMSLEDFKASSLSTTRSEYNSKTNKSLFKRMVDGVQGIGKGLSKVGGGIKKGVTAVATGVKKAAGWVGDKAAGLWNGAKNLASKAWGGAKDLGTKVVGKAKEVGAKAWNVVKGGAGFVADVVKKDVEFVKGAAIAGAKKAGRWLFGSKDEVYYTPDGAYYVKNGDTYDFYSATGSKIAEGFAADEIEAWIKSGQLTPGTREKDGVLTPAINALKTAKQAVVGAWNTGVDAVKKGWTAFSTGVTALATKVGKAVANSEVGRGFKKFFIGTNETRYYDTNGGYYKKSGDSYDYFNATDALVSSGIPEEDFQRMLTSGELTASQVTEQSTVGKIGDKIKSIGKGIANTWNNAMTSLSNTVDSFKQSASKFIDNTKSAIANSAIGQGFRKFFIGTNETRYYDTTGGYYVKVGETYDYFNATGERIGGNIPADTVDPMIINGSLTAQQVTEESKVSQIATSIKTMATNLKDGFVNAINKKVEWAKEVGSKAMEIATSALDSIRENGLFGSIKNFFSKKKEKALFDMKGNYYLIQSDGTYKYFNGNGDMIAEGIPAEEVDSKREEGLLVEGEVETGDSAAKTAINKMKSAIGDAWNKAKDVVSSGWDKFTSWLAGKGGDEITAGITQDMSVQSAGAGGMGGKGGRTRVAMGGKGGSGDTLNGMPYYSQNDPRYKNQQYKQTGGFGNGDTMGESGCGPTAMAMVASKYKGDGYDPTTMARMAEAGGYSTSVGTTPGYFSAAGNALGIPNQRVVPSQESLQTSLANGDSVILQGARGGESRSPYTSEGHYVTATGINGNNVIINDPRGREYSGEYPMKDVLGDTTGMWAFNGGGFGTRKRLKNNLKQLGIGGRGGNSFTVADVIAVAKNEIGYEEKASAQDLYSPHGNKGSNNHTKYEKEVFGSTGNYWCASFVSWCFYQAANCDKAKATQVLGVLSMACETIRSTMMSKGRYDRTVKPGDTIFFTGTRHAGANHIGIVISVDGNTITTVEGNTSSKEFNDNGGCVASHTYSINDGKIMGFGHPAYDDESNFKGVQANPANGETGYSTDGSTSVSNATYSSSDGGKKKFSGIADMLGGLADAVMNPIKKALGFSTDEDEDTSSSSSSSGYYASDGTWVAPSSDGSSMGTGPSVNVSGSNDKEKIWNFLTKTAGFTPNAAAGAMGCWEAESGNNPNTLEGYYLKGVGRDKVPGIISSNENLDAFTLQKLFPAYANSGISINKNAYMVNGHYYPGFGLAQWTGPRAARLLEFAKNKNANWGEVGTQLDFFMNGQGEFKARSGLLQQLNATQTPEDGATVFLDGFEMSAGWHNTTAGQKQNALRRANARSLYNMYNTGAGGKGGKSGVSSRPIRPVSHSAAKKRPLGGFGPAPVTSVPMSMQDSASAGTRSVIEKVNISGTVASGDLSQLLKVAVDYLSRIVDNTGTTNSELEALNSKDFGGTINRFSTTNNNVVDNSKKTYGAGAGKSVADRSEYGMAKRVAAGILD